MRKCAVIARYVSHGLVLGGWRFLCLVLNSTDLVQHPHFQCGKKTGETEALYQLALVTYKPSQHHWLKTTIIHFVMILWLPGWDLWSGWA